MAPWKGKVPVKFVAGFTPESFVFSKDVIATLMRSALLFSDVELRKKLLENLKKEVREVNFYCSINLIVLYEDFNLFHEIFSPFAFTFQ